MKYDLTDIPADLLNNDVALQSINDTRHQLQNQMLQQNDVDTCYEHFCDMVIKQMEIYLPARTIHVNSGLQQKRKKIKKPWWNDTLNDLFSSFLDADRKWSRANGASRAALKEVRKMKQKEFDSAKQRAKRNYWRSMQEQMLTMQDTNPKEYWKYVGKLGVAQERTQTIPWEVVQNDGSVSRDKGDVLERWRSDFESLLNPAAEESDSEPMLHAAAHVGTLSEIIENDITWHEVAQSVQRAKNG